MPTKHVTLQLNAKTQQYMSNMKKADKSTKGMFGSLGKLKGAIISTAAAYAGFRILKSITAAAIRQENAFKQLEQRIKSTGGVAGLTATELKGMAAGLQQVTTFGDEAIMEAQGMLLTFTKIGKEVFPQTTESILNLSVAMGQDLRSSVVMLGKVLNDPVANMGALSRSGIQFTDTQKAMIKELQKSGDLLGAQTIILAELETQFGGAARAAAETFGGKLKQLGNTFGDFQEEVGRGVTESESFNDAIESLNETFNDPALINGVKALVVEIADLIAKTVHYITLVPQLIGQHRILAEQADRVADNYVDMGNKISDLGIAINKAGQDQNEYWNAVHKVDDATADLGERTLQYQRILKEVRDGKFGPEIAKIYQEIQKKAVKALAATHKKTKKTIVVTKEHTAAVKGLDQAYIDLFDIMPKVTDHLDRAAIPTIKDYFDGVISGIPSIIKAEDGIQEMGDASAKTGTQIGGLTQKGLQLSQVFMGMQGIFSQLGDALGPLGDALGGAATGIGGILGSISAGAVTGGIGALPGILSSFIGFAGNIEKVLDPILNPLSKEQKKMNSLMERFQASGGQWTEEWQSKFSNMFNELGDGLDAQIVKNQIQQIWDDMGGVMNDLVDDWDSYVRKIMDTVELADTANRGGERGGRAPGDRDPITDSSEAIGPGSATGFSGVMARNTRFQAERGEFVQITPANQTSNISNTSNTNVGDINFNISVQGGGDDNIIVEKLKKWVKQNTFDVRKIIRQETR